MSVESIFLIKLYLLKFKLTVVDESNVSIK